MSIFFEQKRFVVCLLGPTASGKTDLALQLIQHYPMEIISVDSAMIYKEMNIGTAKPNQIQIAAAPHHLIDIRDPKESYSVMQFCSDATKLIEMIFAKGRIPLLVGGTMLYFHALQQGLSKLPATTPEIKDKINQQAQKEGWAALHEKLRTIDPQSAEKIHPNDPQRLARALAVYELTGMPLSSFYALGTEKLHNYDLINIALVPSSRELLHQRIAQRFHLMLQQGLVDEVSALFFRGDLTADLPSMRAVGYRQVWQFLAHELSYDEMVNKGIIATRQLAKRQLTWLKSWQNIHWVNSDALDVFEQVNTIITPFVKGEGEGDRGI